MQDEVQQPEPNDVFTINSRSKFDAKDPAEAQILITPNDRTVHNLAPHVLQWEKTQDHPFRRRGTFKAADVTSLIAWATRNCPTAPFFASGAERLNGEWKKPVLKLIAIGNYSGAEPCWHDFTGEYAFPVTQAWSKWAAVDGEWMKQGAFAEFIEDHIYELTTIRSGENLSEACTRFLEHTKEEGKPGKGATPSQIVELSRGLKLTSSAKVETRVAINSGEATLNYTEEHQGQGGRPIKVPQLFFIRIPVFFGQPETLVGVRLRYRVDAPSVIWSVAMFAPDMIVRDSFMALVDEARRSELQPVIVLGDPDRPTAIA